MAASNVTTTTAANHIPEFWSKKVQSAAEFKCVIKPRVNHEYEGDVSAMGDIVNITTLNNYTANTKSASTDVTFESHTHAVQQLTIDTHQYAAVKVEKIAEKQAMPGYIDQQTKKMGYALARAQDVNLSARFDGFGDNGTIGTLGVELTDNNYLTAWQKLAEAGAIDEAMVEQDVSIFLSPAAWAAALKLDKFISRDYVSNADGVTKAGLPTIYGAKAFMSNLLESDATGQHDCAFMHKDALAMAVQIEPTVDSDWIIESIATAVVAHVLYGSRELTWPQETAASVTQTDNRGCYLATV